MAPGKELRFFSEYYDKGARWYATHFAEAGSEKQRGEASPGYFHREEVIERIAATLPGARFIVSFRNPVDRLYSHYWLMAERGKAEATFDRQILRELRARRGYFLDQSKYVDHFDRWLALFERKQFHTLFFEDFIVDPAESVRAICRFLEIDEIVPTVVGEVVNEYRHIKSTTVRRLAKRCPKAIRDLVGRLNSRSAMYPPMRDELRKELDDFFAPYNDRLRERLNLRLPNTWSVQER